MERRSIKNEPEYNEKFCKINVEASNEQRRDPREVEEEKGEYDEKIFKTGPEAIHIKKEIDKEVSYKKNQNLTIEKLEFDKNDTSSFQDLERKLSKKKGAEDDDKMGVEERSTKRENEEIDEKLLITGSSHFDKKKFSPSLDLKGKLCKEKDEDNMEIEEGEEEGDDDDDDDEEEEESETESESEVGSQRMYWCTLCWKDFRYRLHLKRHIRRWHQKDKPPKYECVPCKEGFYKPTKFTEHFRKCPYRHMQKKLFECRICNMAFPIFQSCLDHERTAHSSSKSFICNLCGKAFRLKKTLNHHLTMHKEFQNYCKVCNRPFRRIADLRKHLMTHDNKVPYLCGKCNLGFTEKREYKKHNKVTHKSKSHWYNPKI